MEATPSKHKFNGELFKAYEEGKHRRYGMLYAVNGGAFAVAKLLDNKGTAGVGGLTMSHLAVGMIAFTTVIAIDIFVFGVKMRREWKKDEPEQNGISLFGLTGRLVLFAIWFLISFGWYLLS